MTLLEIATQIHQDLESPDSPTVGVIQYWLRHHTTELNNLINTGYTIDGNDGSIEPDLSDQDSAIIKKMYMVYHYDTKVRANLGAAGIDSILEVAENGAIIRMQNKNEISKSYIQMRKETQMELNNLVTFYRGNNSAPQAVAGTDDVDVWYDGVNSNVNVRNISNL